MTDIFVSYASEDLERVKPLVAALEEGGWSVWWDRELVAGPSYDEKIEEALDSSRCVVVVWSANSIRSTWVRTEANEGLIRNVLVPLLIDDVRPPLAFRIAQTAKMIGWPEHEGQLATLNKGITELLGEPSREDIQATNSIAVLPFVNISNDPDQEYFSDGISEDILNGLAKFNRIKVIARTSSFEFKGENRDIRVIGKRLGVNHILEGSVRKAGQRIRVTAQLITVGDGAHIWSEQYNRELLDVFAVQDEITEEILNALDIQLSGTEAKPRRAVNIDAYNAYLLGQYHFNRGQFAQARDSYEKAVSLDSAYADAYAGLADSYGLYATVGDGTFAPNQSRIDDLYARTRELDPDNPRLFLRQAHQHFYVDRDYQLGINEYNDVVKKQPSNVLYLNSYGFALLSLARRDMALECLRRGTELDPLQPLHNQQLGSALTVAGEFEEAQRYLEHAGSLGFPNALMLADLAVESGDIQLLRNQLHRDVKEWGEYGAYYPLYKSILAFNEDPQKAQEDLSQSKDTSSLPPIFNLFMALAEGDTELSISIWRRNLMDGDVPAFSMVHRNFKLLPKITDHPKFLQLLRDFGLDESSLSELKIPPLPF